MQKAKKILKGNITYCKSAYDAARGCDCLVVVTGWSEFKKADFKRLKKILKNPVIVDGRNIYNPQEIKKLGFIYTGIGRKV